MTTNHPKPDLSKATPGPWYWTTYNQDALQIVADYIEDGTRIYCAIGTVDILHNTEEARRIAEANARLISAAPDLLKAVHGFLCAPCVGSSINGGADICVQDFRLRDAAAAVSKATGKDLGSWVRTSKFPAETENQQLNRKLGRLLDAARAMLDKDIVEHDLRDLRAAIAVAECEGGE